MTAPDDARAATLAAYDALAPHFRELSEERAAFLDGVDRVVLAEAPRGAGALLDVGAGDGVRGERLAAALGVRTLVLAEPCARMADACRLRFAAEVWGRPAEDLPATGPAFDVVTCLWNVLGHVPGTAARVAALGGMRRLLAPGGVVVLDVQHRYCVPAYGLAPTLGRALRDAVLPSERNGDVAFAWRVGGATIPARGHVFTTREVPRLACAAGLRVVRRHVLDPRTGAPRRRPWEGHLVYVLAAV